MYIAWQHLFWLMLCCGNSVIFVDSHTVVCIQTLLAPHTSVSVENNYQPLHPWLSWFKYWLKINQPSLTVCVHYSVFASFGISCSKATVCWIIEKSGETVLWSRRGQQTNTVSIKHCYCFLYRTKAFVILHVAFNSCHGDAEPGEAQGGCRTR